MIRNRKVIFLFGAVRTAAILGVVAWFLWTCIRPPENDSRDVRSKLEAEILERCPDDRLLVSRLVSERLYVAHSVAMKYETRGLRVIDVFGDEAVESFERQPSAFEDLMELFDLDGAMFAASVGPWQKAVLEWARAGTLRIYLDRVRRLSASEAELLRETPGCLPLLGVTAPTAHAMLAKYGVRAWHLFMLVDFADQSGGPDSVERVAQALKIYGTRILDVNEQFGLAFALFFVAPPDDREQILPQLFASAIERLGADEACALFVANFDDLAKLVRTGKSLGDLDAAIQLLASQAPEIRLVASDSGFLVRLLLETRGRDAVGMIALKQCGPFAADLLFERLDGYGAESAEKNAALILIKHESWPAALLLKELHGDPAWHKLLRRTELHEPFEDPLLARIARDLLGAENVQDAIDRFLKMPRSQIEAGRYPPTTGEKALDWIPGYVALKAIRDASHGHHLDHSEIGWAVVDGAMTVTLVGKVVGQAVKTVGRQVAREGAKESLERTGQEIIKKGTASTLRDFTREAFRRLPGMMLQFVKNLPSQAGRRDIMELMRSATSIGRNVGVRTWGKLSRRVIQLGNRKVVIDLADPKFLATANQELREELFWSSIAYVVGEVGPCLMEKVHPNLAIPAEGSR